MSKTSKRCVLLLSAAFLTGGLPGCSSGTSAPSEAEAAVQRKAKADAIKGLGAQKPAKASKGAAGKARVGTMPGDDI